MQAFDTNSRINTTFAPYVIEVPHLGVTLRSMLGAASVATIDHLESDAATLEELKTTWRPKFSIKYKGVIVGQLRLKTKERMLKESYRDE